MELEELKKSWNALDEHLKDKEFIKEEELEKLIRHADKGIHAIARLNIKLILISLPILILFLAEVLLHNRLNPIYIIIIFAWIPALCWDIVTTRFLQRTQIDEMPLVEVISRVNRIHRWTIRERLIAIAFLLVLAILLYDPGFSTIDAVIVKRAKNDYVMVLKDNTRPERNLKIAFSDSMTGPYSPASQPFTESFVEGPSVEKVGDDYLIYFDVYKKKIYGAMRTKDFRNFTDVTEEISIPVGHKHGTIFTAPESVVKALLEEKK